LAYALTDTLQLTKTLYPEILQLSKDTAFAEALVVISDPLLDSSLISMDDILPFKNGFLQQARRKYKVLKANQSQWWQYNSLISLMGKFNDKESNALLQQYLGLPIPNVKYNTIIPLIKNGQQVSPTEMKNLAADKNFRAGLYYKLKEINKQQLFPTAYANQQSLAESELYQIASDDYEVGATTFVGERVVLYQGKKKKFYLYKVTLNVEEGERESYLAIAGPYDLKAKALIPYADASGFYWDEPYNRQKVEQQLKSYITSMEAAEE
jgi:hypothetical protein